MILESGGHSAPKPTPRQSKIVNESAECVEAAVTSGEQKEPIDRSSGDFTETKKFWQSLESGTPSEESKPIPAAEPPVPRPRMQVAFVVESKQVDSALKTENIVQEISQTSLSTESASASASAQATEPSEDVQIPTDERLEDESFPIAAKSIDSDSREYGQESLELDSSHSDKSIYKLKEREDILDLDDEEDEPAKKAASKLETAAEKKPASQGGEEDENNCNPTSFYIGESSVNIITKSATEKRSEFAFDNDGYDSTQDTAHDELRKDISDDRFSKSSTHEMEASTISDFEKTHEFLEAEREAADGEKVEKNEIEPSEKETSKQENIKSIQQTQNFLEAERIMQFSNSEKNENECSEKQSLLISASAEDVDMTFKGHLQPVIFEAQQADLLESDTSITEGSPVIQSPASSTKSGKTYSYDVHSVESEEDKAMQATNEPIVSFPREHLDPLGSEHSEENQFIETPKEKPSVNLPEEMSLSEKFLHEEADDALLRKIGAGVVHSPIEAKISNISFDDQPISILDQCDELQQANEVHSPVQITPNVAATSQIVHFDYDDEPIEAKKTAVIHSPVQALIKPFAEPDLLIQTEDSTDLQQADASGAKTEVVHRRIAPKVPPGARWSVTDPDNYSSSGSRCESLENSRPCSSDVENLCPSSFANSSADYQTAQDASLAPGSTDYFTAASTVDHSGKTISSEESMKSFDSEATETLVPSASDLELQSDSQISKEVDLDSDEKEQQLASLETFSDALIDDQEPCGTELIDVSPFMKRSHEMIFQPDPIPLDSVDIQEPLIESLERRKSDDEQKSGFTSLEESRFATSLEEGSVLSMSFSSTDNVETIVENNQDDLASSFGSSLIGSYEAHTLLRDDMTGTSFDDLHKGISENVDLVMTTSLIQEDNVSSANTQVTSGETPEAIRRVKGHKRNDSTAFVKTLDASKFSTESTDSSSLDEEMVVHESADEERKESDTDSDDHYATEYSRSFKQPQKQRKKKNLIDKKIEMPEMDMERKKSVPSIETIVEDVIAEVEMEPEQKRAASQNMMYFTSIPDIKVDLDDEEIPQSPLEQTEDKPFEPAPVEPAPAKREEKAKPIDISEQQYQQLIDQQAKVASASAGQELKSDSPTSDSFEMLEQPDETDDFVIVEEVAKEADEEMDEGKSVSIKSAKYVKKHDDEVEKILPKSAPAATNEGSNLLQGRHDLAFEFEESPPSGGATGESSDEGGPGVESSRKWVEMQLAEQAQNMRYPYEMERGMLEDIKEEDTDLDIGSSRISSFKDSFSSSDFDAVGKRYAAKEHDNVSMSSLQEFESLEQAISLENRKFHQGSQDSLSNGSFPRRYTGRSAQADEISLASLKEFEGLENACFEATLLELKAKEEAQLLSRSDESNKSNKSGKGDGIPPAERTVTVTKTVTTVTRTRVDEPEEDFSSSNLPDVSSDSIEHAKKQLAAQGKELSRHGSCDSLEISKSGDIMTSSIDSIEVSKDGGVVGKSSKSEADSIEFGGSARDSKRDSIDSIDMQYALMAGQMTKVQRDSLDGSTTFVDVSSVMTSSGNQIFETTRITTSVASSSGYGGGISKDISTDSLNIQHSEPELLLTSTESLDHTSSTNATYQNADSQMTLSGSMTSCDSNTLVDVVHSDFQSAGEATRVITTRATTIHSTITDSDNDQWET